MNFTSARDVHDIPCSGTCQDQKVQIQSDLQWSQRGLCITIFQSHQQQMGHCQETMKLVQQYF